MIKYNLKVKQTADIWSMFDEIDNEQFKCKKYGQPVKQSIGSTENLRQHIKEYW